MGVPEGTHPSLWAPEDHSLRPRLPVDAVLMTDSYVGDREMIGHIVAHDAVAAEYYRTRCAPARGVHPLPLAPVRIPRRELTRPVAETQVQRGRAAQARARARARGR